MRATGLYTYILNNNLKSLGLLAGFLVVVQVMFAAIWAFVGIFHNDVNDIAVYSSFVWGLTRDHALGVAAGSLVWCFLAFLYYKRIVRDMTGLKPANRMAEPRLFNTVENLAIATGISTPRIEISESMAMNAFAMGLTPAGSTIGVTRGLLMGLNDKELEAVIAHELTHIRTLDVRLMTFATIFCGIIFSIGWFLTYRLREMYREFYAKPFVLVPVAIVFVVILTAFPTRFPWHVFAVTGSLIMTALLISLCLRFAMSRNREFVADLGACELTKNPEALISALAKIEGRNLMPECDKTVQAMMISAPSDGYFASHPKIEDRIDAIVAYAATHLNGLRLAPASQRFLPQPTTAAISTGFSITAMKYPAWISKPLIVIPALLVGLFVNYTLAPGNESALARLTGLPQLIAALGDAPISENTVSSATGLRGPMGFDDPGASVLDFFAAMDAGDWKILILYILIAGGISLCARFIRKLGFDSDALRSIAGAPSKIMESDWDDDTTKHATQLNVAVPTIQPPSPPGQRAVFGKR
jgi:heat shock protein HtpX